MVSIMADSLSWRKRRCSFDPEEAGLGAFGGDRQITLYAFVADDIRIGIARLALGHGRQFGFRSVIVGVIGDQYVGASLGNNVAEPLRRMAIVLEPEFIGPIRSDVRCPLRNPIK